MFKDYTENGEKIAGYEPEGPSVGDRVDRAVAQQTQSLLRQYKDQGIRLFSRGESEYDAAQKNKQKLNHIAHDILQSVYNAAEAEILRFIQSGADVIGRFPQRYYACFELVSENGHREEYYLHYFDFLRVPAVISDLRAEAQIANQLKREWGGILRRIIFLLMALPAFFVTLSWESVQQFAKYEDLVKELFQAPIVSRGFSCLLILLFLLPYVVSDFRYRDRNSPYNPWILTFVQGYFFITALVYTGIRPIRSGEMNFMVEGILWSFYCFSLFLPVELWRLHKSLNSDRQYRKIFKARKAELDNAQRLLLFYRIWWKSERMSYMHPAIAEAESSLNDLYEQYTSGRKRKMNR